MLFKPFYIMMVGLPGSGKSSVIKEIKNPKNFEVLSTDAFIDIAAKANCKTYSEVFEQYIKMAQQNFNDEMKLMLERRMNIVHDQTNLTRKKRIATLKKVPSDYYKVALVVTCNEVERLERLKERAKTGKVIPEHVNQSMKASFQMPDYDSSEGFNHVIYRDTSSRIYDTIPAVSSGS